MHYGEGGWGGDEEFSCIIKQKTFDYIGVHFQQNTDCSIILDQNQYINTINLMPISPEQSRQCYHPLSKEETTLLRGALRKLNWVAGMTRSEISFHVCEISTKIKTTAISDIISVKKVIKFIKNTPPPPQKNNNNTPSHIKIPSLELGSVLWRNLQQIARWQ